MECNKDEALRAKVIAENKLSSKDYSGAKKFALKAKSLYPELDGISQMLTILDVYTSAESKIHGEIDWYGVLGISPNADDETVKKAYRKLALTLHPDKNKSVGADGAFKYVSEAWTLLSDKAKRSAYNQKRNLKGCPDKVSPQTGVPSAPFRSNDFQRYAGRSATNIRGNHSSTSQSGAKVAPQKDNTFWTICNDCKTHYEYLRIYQNQNLLCPNCNVAFLALESPPPSKIMKPVHWSSNQYPRSSFQNNATNETVSQGKEAVSGKRASSASYNSFQLKKFRHGPYSEAVNSLNPLAPQVPVFNHESKDREKGSSEDAQPPARWEARDGQSKLNSGLSSSICTSNINATAGYEALMKRRMAFSNVNNVYGGDKAKSGSGCKELPVTGIRALLIEKAATEIHKRVTEWSSTGAKISDRLDLKTNDGWREMVQNIDNKGSNYLSRNDVPGVTSKDHLVNSTSPSANDVGTDDVEQISMTVPDPDFHNFDMDRTERSFGENEIWASYDDDDGMPRFYALVHKVISTNPFKLKISWLNSKSSSEFAMSNWVDSGFTKTCGIFRIGKHETSSYLNSFSHKVEWTKIRGAVHIYPKKGEVWALYKNWSADWDENTPDEVIHKYDMVEVCDDYSEEQGVSVIPLIKVPGFRTVFRSQADPGGISKIAKEEMFRFSHQVPYYIITGKEAENAPEGCRELDPAATPVELLQVIYDSNETGATSLIEKGRSDKE
uniref:J domain-containing protein n=1 Tax=Kalanchoe fedtschenkoi TaxID=63787 RepID=A0A7N0TFT7_KALFE